MLNIFFYIDKRRGTQKCITIYSSRYIYIHIYIMLREDLHVKILTTIWWLDHDSEAREAAAKPRLAALAAARGMRVNFEVHPQKKIIKRSAWCNAPRLGEVRDYNDSPPLPRARTHSFLLLYNPNGVYLVPHRETKTSCNQVLKRSMPYYGEPDEPDEKPSSGSP